MKAYIDPPAKMPFYIKVGLFFVKRATGKDLLPPKLLAWYPKAAISSAVMEALVAHGKPSEGIEARLLQLIRVHVSILVSCPFCVDMNGNAYEQNNITQEEIQGLTGLLDLDLIPTLSEREKCALKYTRLISQTPVEVSDDFMEVIKKIFNEQEIVIMVTTVAQVNYWARLIRALGIPSAEFMNHEIYGG